MTGGDPRPLGDLAMEIVVRLPVPAKPRQDQPAEPVPVHAHPFVRAVLAAFPGAEIVDAREDPEP